MMKQIFMGVILGVGVSCLQAAQIKTQSRVSRSVSDGAMQSSMKNEETQCIQTRQRAKSVSSSKAIHELTIKFIGEAQRINLKEQQQLQKTEEAQKRSSMLMTVSRILNDKTKNKKQADSNAKQLADYERWLGFKIVDWTLPEDA